MSTAPLALSIAAVVALTATMAVTITGIIPTAELPTMAQLPEPLPLSAALLVIVVPDVVPATDWPDHGRAIPARRQD